MSLYSASIRTSNATINQAAAELRAGANQRLYVKEVGIIVASAVASVVGLGTPAAIGVTPGTTTTPLPEDPQDNTSTGTVAASWGTSPTNPTTYLRRAALPTIGSAIIWSFYEQGLVIAKSSSLVIQNITANAVFDVWFVFDE